MTIDQASEGSKPHDDDSLLRAIQAQLRSTYSDVLRQPLPESIKNVLKRLEAVISVDDPAEPGPRAQ
jgi:Anti-sigma factor NepR